jgi:quercetin dioxygenase-like cupin family protein
MNTPTSGIVPLTPAFADARGTIQNLVEHECGGVGLIHTKAGSRRSSHYHLTDSHYLYIVSGKARYRERKVGTETVVEFWVGPGQMVHTGPMVEHWMSFPEDTVMISVSKLSRQHDVHEADLVRVDWLDG